MYPVPTFTQEHPSAIWRGITRLSRLAPPRGLTPSAICYIRNAMYNPPPHSAHAAWWRSGRKQQTRAPESVQAFLSQTRNAMKIMHRWSTRKAPRPYCQTWNAYQQTRRRAGLVSMTKRVQLDNILDHIDSHTAWMGRMVLAAE